MQRSTIADLITRSTKVTGLRSKNAKSKATGVDPSVKVLGKLCPCCGIAGEVLCETNKRIIYECPNRHQYETRKRIDKLYDEDH